VPARNAKGRFPKERFAVDLDAGSVTCPAGQTRGHRPRRPRQRPGIVPSLVRRLPAGWLDVRTVTGWSAG
jgi:hypothetical protein